MWGRRRSLLIALLCGVAVLVLAPTADAARFRLSVTGFDALDWNVANPGTCGRSGSGFQDVHFHTGHAVTIQIRQHRRRRNGRTIRELIFGRGSFGLTIAMPGDVYRSDDTSGSYFSQSEGQCKDIGGKDCVRKPLEGFAPTIFSNSRAGFTLEAGGNFYWQTAESPFQNCIALETPVPNVYKTEQPYTGWRFGNEPLARDDDSTVATRSVSPDALRVGRTYRFTAHKIVKLSDKGFGYRYLIQDNGGAGPPDTSLSDSPGGRLGGDRSISDNITWTVTLKRVS